MGVITKIIKQKGDWQEVVNDCRFTVNKEDLGKEPSQNFKRKILIGEHSPIRDISFKWEWRGIKHWVVVHWVRHKWECFVNTQRSDRTGEDRDSFRQDTPQNFRGEGNIQHLIDTMRKRLCLKASKETMECAISLKSEIHNYEPEISDVLVPSCIYRCGCSEHMYDEPNKCMFFEHFVKDFPADRNIYNIQDRYDVYNEKFKKGNKS
jgi:hypothetical protein